MGNTESSSEISNAVKQTIKQDFSASQNLSDSQFCNQNISLTNCNFTNVRGGLTIQNMCNSSKVLRSQQKASTDQISSNTLSQKLSAAASATGQNLNLNPGDITANSLVQNYTNLSTDIQSAISNQLQSTGVSSQNIVCEGSSFSDIGEDVRFIQRSDLDSVATTIADTLQAAQSVQDMKQTLSATATATQEDTLGKIMIAIIICFGLVTAAVGKAAIFGGLVALLGVLALANPYKECKNKKSACVVQVRHAPGDGSGGLPNLVSNPCCVNVADGADAPQSCIIDNDTETYKKVEIKSGYSIKIPLEGDEKAPSLVNECATCANLNWLFTRPPLDGAVVYQDEELKGTVIRLLGQKSGGGGATTFVGFLIKVNSDVVVDDNKAIEIHDGSNKLLIKIPSDAILSIEAATPAPDFTCYDKLSKDICPVGCKWGSAKKGVPRDSLTAMKMCDQYKSEFSSKNCVWKNSHDGPNVSGDLNPGNKRGPFFNESAGFLYKIVNTLPFLGFDYEVLPNSLSPSPHAAFAAVGGGVAMAVLVSILGTRLFDPKSSAAKPK